MRAISVSAHRKMQAWSDTMVITLHCVLTIVSFVIVHDATHFEATCVKTPVCKQHLLTVETLSKHIYTSCENIALLPYAFHMLLHVFFSLSSRVIPRPTPGSS